MSWSLENIDNKSNCQFNLEKTSRRVSKAPVWALRQRRKTSWLTLMRNGSEWQERRSRAQLSGWACNLIMSSGGVFVCGSDVSQCRILWKKDGDGGSPERHRPAALLWRSGSNWNLRICWYWLSGNWDGYYGNPDVDSGAGLPKKLTKKKKKMWLFVSSKKAKTSRYAFAWLWLFSFGFFSKPTCLLLLIIFSCNQMLWAFMFLV